MASSRLQITPNWRVELPAIGPSSFCPILSQNICADMSRPPQIYEASSTEVGDGKIKLILGQALTTNTAGTKGAIVNFFDKIITKIKGGYPINILIDEIRQKIYIVVTSTLKHCYSYIFELSFQFKSADKMGFRPITVDQNSFKLMFKKRWDTSITISMSFITSSGDIYIFLKDTEFYMGRIKPKEMGEGVTSDFVEVDWIPAPQVSKVMQHSLGNVSVMQKYVVFRDEGIEQGAGKGMIQYNVYCLQPYPKLVGKLHVPLLYNLAWIGHSKPKHETLTATVGQPIGRVFKYFLFHIVPPLGNRILAIKGYQKFVIDSTGYSPGYYIHPIEVDTEDEGQFVDISDLWLHKGFALYTFDNVTKKLDLTHLNDYRRCAHCQRQEMKKRKNYRGKRIADFRVCRECKQKNFHKYWQEIACFYCSIDCMKKDWRNHKKCHRRKAMKLIK